MLRSARMHHERVLVMLTTNCKMAGSSSVKCRGFIASSRNKQQHCRGKETFWHRFFAKNENIFKTVIWGLWEWMFWQWLWSTIISIQWRTATRVLKPLPHLGDAHISTVLYAGGRIVLDPITLVPLMFWSKSPILLYQFANFRSSFHGVGNKYINSVGCQLDGRAIWRLLIPPDTEEEEPREGTLWVIFAFMCLPYPISKSTKLCDEIFKKLIDWLTDWQFYLLVLAVLAILSILLFSNSIV